MSSSPVRRWVARRRRGEPVRPPHIRIPSIRRITRWLAVDPAVLPLEEKRFVKALVAAAPGLRTALEQVRACAELLRQRHAADLDPWLADAATTELRGCPVGLRQDEAAVRAAMTEPWSNGSVEG